MVLLYIRLNIPDLKRGKIYKLSRRRYYEEEYFTSKTHKVYGIPKTDYLTNETPSEIKSNATDVNTILD